MLKPDELRKAIVAVVPYLARDPDRLMMWIERGSVSARLGPDFSFQFSYQLNVLITDFAEDVSLIAIAIIAWLRVNQPELMVPPKNTFDFEADFLDLKSTDLQFKLDLQEMVSVTRREDGGFDMEYLPEPDPLLPDDDMDVPPLAEIWLTTGEKLLPDVPPLGADVQPEGAAP